MTTKIVDVELDSEERGLPESATITQPLEEILIRELITARLLQQSNLADDLTIAVEVVERDARDTGERIRLEDFMRQEGYEPSEFGLE